MRFFIENRLLIFDFLYEQFRSHFVFEMKPIPDSHMHFNFELVAKFHLNF
jgi:hypothetical protein